MAHKKEEAVAPGAAAAEKAPDPAPAKASAPPTPEPPDPHPVDGIDVWIGTLAGCPWQVLHLRGIGFPAITEKVTHAKGALKTQRSPYRGAIVQLLPEKAKELAGAIRSYVARIRGQRARLVKKDASYRAYTGDRELADLVFMIPLDEAVRVVGPNWRQEEPPPFSQLK